MKGHQNSTQITIILPRPRFWNSWIRHRRDKLHYSIDVSDYMPNDQLFIQKGLESSILIFCCWQNWYRVAQDESLWKGLAFKALGSRFTLSNVSWKSELKRLVYHTPVHLHQTCAEHEDEVYNVCFSNSGQFIATCGLDGHVKVCRIPSVSMYDVPF